MTVDRRVAAALRAQAAGVSGAVSVQVVRRRSGVPGWRVLAFAVLLGGVAGGLAGVVSVW